MEKNMTKKGMKSSVFVDMITNIIYILSVEEDNEEPEDYSLDDINTKVMVLNENIADDMWFL
jgi:hypothetical protein